MQYSPPFGQLHKFPFYYLILFSKVFISWTRYLIFPPLLMRPNPIVTFAQLHGDLIAVSF